MSIDNSISLNHYDIALIAYELLKDNFRYKGKNNWEYYNNDKKEWIIDINKKELITSIKSIVVNKYLDMIFKINADVNVEDKDFKITRLLQIANKLKNQKFIIDLIKELKQFYNDN